MAASPEFYRPAATASLTPPSLLPQQQQQDHDYGCCRTPTGSGISYLKEPTTCPPAPRKPPPLCKKRLFHRQQQQQQVISLRLDDLERIFRPHPKPSSAADLPTSTTQSDLISSSN